MNILEQLKTNITTVEILQRTETTASTRQLAFQLAQQHSQRTKLLILGDSVSEHPYAELTRHVETEIIPAGNSATLCSAIANSAERLAAIIVTNTQASSYYFKKVRELTSAEGAVMIWDALNQEISQFNLFAKISKHSQPDIICFSINDNKTTTWIGGKKNILQEKQHEFK